MRPRVLIPVLCAFTLGALALPASAGLRPNPADDPRLVDLPIEEHAYDYAKRCKRRPTRGIKSLRRWLGRNLRGEAVSTVRCEKLGTGNYSLHAEGRALDWGLDAGIGKERRAAKRLIRTLLRSDASGEPQALARRMGVQGLIFNCRDWFAPATTQSRYEYCFRADGTKRRHLDRTQAHMDHIHIELNWAGARKQTSFWQSAVSKE